MVFRLQEAVYSSTGAPAGSRQQQACQIFLQDVGTWGLPVPQDKLNPNDYELSHKAETLQLGETG